MTQEDSPDAVRRVNGEQPDYMNRDNYGDLLPRCSGSLPPRGGAEIGRVHGDLEHGLGRDHRHRSARRPAGQGDGGRYRGDSSRRLKTPEVPWVRGSNRRRA